MEIHHSSWKLAIQVTLHCLLGCATGEILGLVIGTALGWSNLLTVALAVGLAFLFGYLFALLPLRSKMPWRKAFKLVLAAETLSITVMEIVDNGIMLAVPHSMNSISEPVFWLTMIAALVIAFIATIPVNKILLDRSQGHMLLHEHHAH